MSDKLTEEEHHARAALLGMKYGSYSHMYYKRGENGDTTTRLDADTLEPISSKEAMRRSRANYIAETYGNIPPARAARAALKDIEK